MTSVVTRAVVLKGASEGDKDADEYELINNFECPQLGDEDVLVKVETCALSRVNLKALDDLKLWSGEMLPVGREISGVISQVGKAVTRVQVDDEVAGIIPLDLKSSGCGNVCVISQYDIVKKPTNVGHVDAAAAIGDALKAYTALYYLAKVSSGDTILICNGASGFGLMATQLAQHIGAKVISTVSSEEEMHFLKGQQPPVAQIVDLRTKKQSLVATCMVETGGLGVDCVIDNGVEMYSNCVDDSSDDLMKFDDTYLPHKHDVISSLAVAGKWITTQRNLQLDPPDSRLLFLKSASLHFLFEESWTLSRGAQGKYLHILEDIMNKISNGTLRPLVHHSVQLEDCAEALKKLGENKVGRFVVKTT